MPRFLRQQSKYSFITAASSALLACACVTSVHAGPPGGIAYGGFTATTGTVSSTCSAGDPACGSSTTGSGFYQRSVDVGGQTYFQTIVLPNPDTSSTEISPISITNECYVQTGGGIGLGPNISIPPLGPVTPYLFDASLFTGKTLSTTVINQDCSIESISVTFPEVPDLPQLVSDGFPIAAFKAKIIDGASGAEVFDNQGFAVTPSISFGLNQVVMEGGTASVKVYASRPPSHAVVVPYTISGTATPLLDHGAVDGTVTIEPYTTTGEMSFPIYKDAEADDGETVVVSLGKPSGDAVLGENTVHTVTVSENSPFIAVSLKRISATFNVALGYSHLYLLQDCCAGDGDPVTVKADAKPNFPAGELQYDWSGTDSTILSLANVSGDTLSFYPDRQSFSAGVYTIKVKVSSVDEPMVEASSETSLKVITDFDTTSLNGDNDSDSDGKIDGQEGIFIDSNENGIDNNLDAFDAENILQMYPQPVNQGISKLDRALEDGTQISFEWDGFIDSSIAEARLAITSDAGTRLLLGKVAFALGSNGAMISIGKFKQNAALVFPEQTNLLEMDKLLGDAIADVEVADLPTPGQSAHIVVPRVNPSSGDSVIWAFNPDKGWGKFQLDEHNGIASATGYKVGDKLFSCPGGQNIAFASGLADECVRLTVEDGGPNDADGAINGVVSLMIGEGPDIPNSVLETSSDVSDSGVSAGTDTSSGGGTFGIYGLIFLALARCRQREAA